MKTAALTASVLLILQRKVKLYLEKYEEEEEEEVKHNVVWKQHRD